MWLMFAIRKSFIFASTSSEKNLEHGTKTTNQLKHTNNLCSASSMEAFLIASRWFRLVLSPWNAKTQAERVQTQTLPVNSI